MSGTRCNECGGDYKQAGPDPYGCTSPFHDAPTPAPQDEAAKPETQADQLRKEAIALHAVYHGTDAQCKCWMAFGGLADALAEKERAVIGLGRILDGPNPGNSSPLSVDLVWQTRDEVKQRSEYIATLKTENASLLKRATEAETDAAEMQALFDLQYDRTMEAHKLWRAAHPGNDLVSPDLGRLIEWLLKRAEAAERERDEARRLHDEHCKHDFTRPDFTKPFKVGCVPPWRQGR